MISSAQVMNRPPDAAELMRLLACLPDQPERFAERAREVQGWPALLELAGRHGVEQALYEALVHAEIPAPLRARLDEQRAFEQLAGRRRSAALSEVAMALEAADVKAIMLKGPALGERLYPAHVLRPSTDLDVLVGPGALERAAACLEGLGYRLQEDLARVSARSFAHQLILLRPGSPMIELHFRLHSEFGVDLPASELAERARRHTLRDGTTVWILAPEDELLHLALHAAAHRCIRAGWLYDLKLFALRHPELDWALVARRARAHGLSSAVGFALGRAAAELDAPIPTELTQLDRPRAALARLLASAWATHEGPIPVVRASSFAFATMLCDDPAQSVRSMRHLVQRFGARQADALARRLGR